MSRPPLPPFTEETAIVKVRAAEDGWNTRDPGKVALAYTPDCRWRKPSRIPRRPCRDRSVPFSEMVARAGIPAHQGAVDVRRQPHRRALCL